MKVLISDTFSAEGLAEFEQADDIELVYRPGIEADELLDLVTDVDALIVRGGTQVGTDVFDRAEKLRVVARAGIGVENINLNAANRRGVVVMNTPFGSTTTTAEHTLAMLFALARNIPQAHISTTAGNWNKDDFLGVELAGKTLGVIGAGKIGRLVVERARAMRMRILVHDPYLAEDIIRQMGAEPVELEQLLGEADFISLHIPLNAETEHLLNRKTLALCKPGSRIINCATGGLIDEEALVEAIREGRIAGAALDVFSQEPPGNSPLLSLPQVICTPHLRAATRDAQINVTVQAARQVIAFLRHGEVRNALNVPSLSTEMLEELRPCIRLAEQLGLLLAQLCPEPLRRIRIDFAGEAARHPMAPMTCAALYGLMKSAVGSMVNYVNAPHLARERGIEITEAKISDSGGYSSLMRLSIETDHGSHSASGAFFGGQGRIVGIDGYPVETTPDGPALILYNNDQPGVVGTLGQILGQAHVNIASMNLARGENRALSVIRIDTPVTDEIIQQMTDHPAVDRVVQVIF